MSSTDGRLVEIVAEAEPLIEVRGREPAELIRLAWHLGNRHLETEIGAKWLRIRRDHVIADMLRGLGARVAEIEAPFQPEGGAYAHGAAGPDHGGHEHHGHSHHGHHGHDHAGHDHHDHGHDHEPWSRPRGPCARPRPSAAGARSEGHRALRIRGATA